ncbi:AAA family ATPase [Microbacterium sp. H1-D42]|uniref:AAA family ATPase n=1 Tax=Microbacterium sp. H1-D42 TaxID=2925844 RepID=UPI001F533140|nr:AAA family ATPase [Microbacterium sp. H1-D42]UNK71733.1 AAA family ATPase [Microbacterium sp. H1-D42]
MFPLRRNDKTPAIPSAHKGEKGPKCDGRCGKLGHGVLDASTDPEAIRRLFARYPDANIGGATLGRVVFDFDVQHGGKQSDVFPTTREHLSGRGNGNSHLIYRVGGDLARLIRPGAHVLGHGIDIRATHGSYVVLPPSLHPDTLKPYTVADESVPEHTLTDDEVRAIFAAHGKPAPGERKTPDAGSSLASLDLPEGGAWFGGSGVVQLLGSPPERGTGEMNDWLTRVAGHYAQQYRTKRDLYEWHVRDAAAKVDPDYEDTEKVLESIWATEQAKPEDADERQQRVAERVESKLVEHEAKALFARTLAELEPAEPFDVGSLAEILARPDTERFRVDGLLLSEGFTTVVAARKTGKTTFNLNLADSLLSGRDFLGQFPVEPVEGRIALLNFEVAAKQVAHWANLVGVDPDRFDIVTLRGRRNPLLHPQDRADLAEYLRGRKVEFLFVDPFSRAFYGESQQDNTQVQAFLSDLDVFARSEVGATDVVLNVHAGWNADRSRGASALEDHPDSIIWLKPGDREKGDRSTYIEAKGRDVDIEEMQLAFDPTTYRLSLTGEGSRREVKLAQKQSDLEPAILRAVAAEPGINTKGVTENLRTAGVPFQKGDETKTLKAMLEGGRIGWKKGERNASLWYPAGHPDAVTKAPLAGVGEVGF